jgi:hypothetical protein
MRLESGNVRQCKMVQHNISTYKPEKEENATS